MAENTSSCDVVVVGAGVSGLYAAKCLKDEGFHVVVLEAQSRVGGRTWTLRESSDEYADMGGAYFGRRQTRIIQLATELGLKFFPLPTTGKTVMKFQGKVKTFEGDVPVTHNPLELMDLAYTIRLLDTLSLKVPLDKPWMAEGAEKFDSMNVVDFLNSVCWTRFARMLIHIGFAAVFAFEPEKVSMLYALHLIRSCGGAKALFSQSDGLQEMKLIGGSSSISERLADRLGNVVKLNFRVVNISQSKDDGVVLTTNDGSVFKCKAAIIATSPCALKSVHWSPALPSHLSSCVELTQTGHYFKTVMYYSKAFWTEAGFKGDIVCDEGIVRIAFPDTKYDGSYPAIMGFVDGKEFECLTPEQRKTAIANHYADLFGIEALRKPVNYIEKHWDDVGERELSGPCVFTLPPHYITSQRRFWGEPFDRVFFAGSESSTVFRGYMDGAIRAAERAVVEVLTTLLQPPKKAYEDVHKVVDVPYARLTFVERWVPGVPQFISSVILILFAILLSVFI